MKKVFMFLVLILSISKSYSQNIGINATGATPNLSAMLDVSSTDKGVLIPRMTSAQRVAIASPANGLMVYDTDNSSFWVYNGSTLGWAQVNYWNNTGFNSTDIYNTNSGKVGIGTNAPITKLTIKTLTNDYGVTQTDGTITVGTYIGAGEGWLGTRSNHPLTFFTNNGAQAMTLATNGDFGIGNNSPTNRLQIGSMGSAGFNGNDLAFGNGTNATGLVQTNSFLQAASSTDIALMPSNGAGRVGINITAPANTFQIGSVGATGYSSNNFAFGNGTNATGFSQTNSFLQVASSTDIALMPQNNGNGRVGINTTTPKAPLDVENSTTVTLNTVYDGYAFYSVALGSNNVPTTSQGGISTSTEGLVSIYASDRILASEFDAFSDARIKNIIRISNSQKDLETVNSIKVTDYTMKDKVKYGNKLFKKVIAQEVEKVYPQVVSEHSDFIPNVYQLTNKVQKTRDGFLLTFSKKHNISKDAKKLKLLSKESKAMEEVDIKSIPSDYQVLINGNINDSQLFVYGEEVNDFRTVDYEGLTTLNISATQELSKLVEVLYKKIEGMEQQIKFLQNKKDLGIVNK